MIEFRHALPIVSLCLIVIILSGCSSGREPRSEAATPLVDLYSALGRPLPAHAPEERRADLIETGDSLVHRGYAVRDGRPTERISRFFVCVDCHNTEIEAFPPSADDPEVRASYLTDHGLPLLPGSTLKGVVNRASWYNGYYQIKYGEGARRAHNDLEEAVRLCARECSRGREPEPWELEAIMQYLWSLEYRFGELDLSAAERRAVRNALHHDTDAEERERLLAILDAAYVRSAGATLAPPPDDPQVGYDEEGDAGRGRRIYEASCLYCHGDRGPARFDLDTTAPSFRRMAAKIPKTSRSSFYRVLREGYEGPAEHPTYMPLFTAERLSNRQVEDLRAYIELQVE